MSDRYADTKSMSWYVMLTLDRKVLTESPFCHEFIISKQYSQAQEIGAGLGFGQKSIGGV